MSDGRTPANPWRKLLRYWQTQEERLTTLMSTMMKNNKAPIAKVKTVLSEPVPVLSFFTGAGFLDIGFIQAGFETVWHNEYNTEFARGFAAGVSALMGRPYQIENTMSIVDCGANQVVREAFGGVLPDLFGMIGGPPCPDFSVGGKNRGSTGENGILSRFYVDRIIELRPSFFLLENVLGLVRTAKHRAFLDTLKQDLQVHGYHLSQRVLNALEYGVPQDRQRFFLVGIHGSFAQKLGCEAARLENETWFPWPQPIERYKDAKKKYEWAGQTPFGGDLPEPPLGTPPELMVGPLLCPPDGLIPNSADHFKPRSDKFQTIPEGDDSKKAFKRLHRYRYSPTAAYGNNEVHLHPTEPRRISVREALRIQSVPDAYVLPRDMTLTDKFKTVGNGVPVKLAKAVADAFMKLLQGKADHGSV